MPISYTININNKGNDLKIKEKRRIETNIPKQIPVSIPQQPNLGPNRVYDPNSLHQCVHPIEEIVCGGQ